MMGTSASLITSSATDEELLLRWSRDRSAEAFSGLVDRYGRLVQGVARRQLADPGLVEDVTQAVFITLSQKAGTIRAGASLGAWLHQTTCYAVANARKIAARRARHERAAAAERSEVSMTVSDPAGDELSPFLDDAIGHLGHEDRVAIVTRYLQQKEVAEVATALNTTSDAAKKRLSRALQKIRDYLTRKGISTGGTTAAVALAFDHAASSASAASISSASITGIVLGDVSASSTVQLLTQGTLSMLFKAKLQSVTLSLGGALLAALVVATPLVVLAQPKQDQAVSEKAAPSPAPATQKSNDIRGVWSTVGVADDGQETPVERLAKGSVVFTGTDVHISQGKGGTRGKYTIDSTTDPAQIDLTRQEASAKTLGIYQVDGNSMMFIIDERGKFGRPTKFESEVNSANDLLFVLRRESTLSTPGETARAIVEAMAAERMGIPDAVYLTKQELDAVAIKPNTDKPVVPDLAKLTTQFKGGTFDSAPNGDQPANAKDIAENVQAVLRVGDDRYQLNFGRMVKLNDQWRPLGDTVLIAILPSNPPAGATVAPAATERRGRPSPPPASPNR